MLKLVNVKKDYQVAGEAVHALKGVSLNFRRSEFVSILGASGCGKTTLLNIIGGLDHYTSGDLIIEGVSTKTFKDREWDAYRNHSIGFIFQSYHLIPHQTILQNVELALAISGVNKKERRERAIEALGKVGLADKIHNKPNQLSGGQAQRVAIARALINDPEILLADEPTGALDSKTSIQIMELLKEISQDKLVIMVTHNPELAEKYSTRIIRLLDGEVIGDSLPYGDEEERADSEREAAEEASQATAENETTAEAETVTETTDKKSKKSKNGKNKTSMPFFMALSLSLKNLLSKLKRTIMVSVAGSIGIIGVSMVLAISAGVQGYITGMENDMLSGYPVSVTQSAYDFSSLMELSTATTSSDNDRKLDKIFVNSLLDTLGTFSTGFQKTNTITDAYVDYVNKMPEEYVNVVQYGYSFNIVNNIYTDFTVSDNLADHLESGDATGYDDKYNMSITAIRAMYSAVLSKVPEYSTWGSMISTVATFKEIPNNFDYIMSQYDVVAVDKNGEPVTDGYTKDELKELFTAKDSLIMVVSGNTIDDLTLAQYGYFTEDDFLNYAYAGIEDENTEEDKPLYGEDGLEYSKFMGNNSKKFVYYPNDCVYTKTSYVPDPAVPDQQITMLVGSAVNNGVITQEEASTFVQDVAGGRKLGGDSALRAAYNKPSNQKVIAYLSEFSKTELNEDSFVDYFHLPTAEDTVEGFMASAYSTGYKSDNGTPLDSSDDVELKPFNERNAYDKRVEMGIKLILQKKDEISYGCLNTGIYYTNALTNYVLDTEENSEIVNFVNDKGGLKELPMFVDYYYVDTETKKYILDTQKSSIETGESDMSMMIGSITGAEAPTLGAGLFGGSRMPVAIYIYPTDFDTKNKICAYLDAWNDMCLKESKNSNGEVVIGSDYTYIDVDGAEHTVRLEEKDKITYTDTVGIIITMVNTMIQMITIALVAFTALSLVVSTVMIGIITYVSVVERVKEIGILRAVGARKKDIKRLFNAETFIIGLAAGVVGLIVTYLLSLLINLIVLVLAGFWGIAALPWWQALIMVALSICLTLISGLIPAAAAAKKDPVVALRTE